MNARLTKDWGRQETFAYPAAPGPFAVTIVVTEEGYEVHEGGTRRHVFRHRCPWSRFDRVTLEGEWEVAEEEVV